MKRTIRTLFVLMIIFTGTNCFSQTFNYGIVAGIQRSHTKDTNSELGFKIGAKGELGFSNEESRAYLDFGLLLTAKGWKEKIAYLSEHDGTVNWKCRLYYIEIPFHIGYKYALNKDIKLMADVGPYFAFGLTGSTRADSDKNLPDLEIHTINNLFKNKIYQTL